VNVADGWKWRKARPGDAMRVTLAGAIVLAAMASFAMPAGAASTKVMNRLITTSLRSTGPSGRAVAHAARSGASHSPYRKVTSPSLLKTWWPGWPSGSSSEVGIAVTAMWADDPAGNLF